MSDANATDDASRSGDSGHGFLVAPRALGREDCATQGDEDGDYLADARDPDCIPMFGTDLLDPLTNLDAHGATAMSGFASERPTLAEAANDVRPTDHVKTVAFFTFQEEVEVQHPGFGYSFEKQIYLARQIDYLFFDQNTLVRTNANGQHDFNQLYRAINALKDLSRGYGADIRIGINGMGAGLVGGHHILAQELAPFWLHDTDGDALVEPGEFHYLDLDASQARDAIVDGWSTRFVDPNTLGRLDALFFDAFRSPHQRVADLLQQVGASNCAESLAGPSCASSDFWIPNLLDINTRLLNGSSKEIIYNGIKYFEPGTAGNPSVDGNNGSMNEAWLDHASGALLEGSQEVLRVPRSVGEPGGEAVFDAYLSMLNGLGTRGAGRKLFFVIQPYLQEVLTRVCRHVAFGGTCDPESCDCANNTCLPSSLADDAACPGDLTRQGLHIDRELERFFLGMYLLVQKDPAWCGGCGDPITYFGYHPGLPYAPYDIYYYDDWNLPFGRPTGSYLQLGNGLYVRAYGNNVVVVNAGDSPRSFLLPTDDEAPSTLYRFWDPVDGQRISTSTEPSVTLPAHSAAVFFRVP